MTIAKGTRLDGVHTVDDLRQRSTVDEDTGCWNWKLWCWPSGMPGVTLVVKGKRLKVSGRRAALLLSGRLLLPGEKAFAAKQCESVSCVNPAHCQVGGMRDVMRLHAARGKFDDPKHYAHLVRSAKARATISPETRLAIALAEGTAATVAARYGITERMVCRIRSPENTMPATSVFAWSGRV